MTYDIITFGNGEILKSVMDAIAACLRSDTGTLYTPLIRISLIIGGLWATLYAIYGDYMKAITHWIIPMTMIMQLLFVPQVSVWIHDPVSHSPPQKVDHVPYGLAVAASTISKIGNVLTEQVEKLFVLPDDLKYQKTGTLFASHLIQQSNSFRIMNEDLAQNMRHFVGQCVFYDVLHGRKYTIEALRHSDNIWKLISENASPVRSFLWRDPQPTGTERARAEIITCQQGVTRLNAALSYEINTVATFVGKKLFGKNRAIQTTLHDTIDFKKEFLRVLPLAYKPLTDMAGQAEAILKQNMMIYSVVDGLEQASVRAGNAPNFAVRRAYLQQRSTYETLGAMAAETLPSMKAVLEAIAYAAFLFVIPLSVLPFGWRFLSSWLQVLVWLQMWAPLYAILNYMMTIAARSKSMAALSLSNSAGVTIANAVGLVNVNADISAMAGYLGLSIPFLCIALVKGVGSFVQMASTLTQVTQGAGTQAAQDAVTGNYSFGNISSGNRQISNSHMLNHSYAASIRSGSFHQSDGRTDVMTSPDGQKIINMSRSTLPLSLNVSKGLTAQKLEQSVRAYQNALQQSELYFKSMTDLSKTGVDLADHLSHSTQLNKTTSRGITLDESKASSRMGQQSDDLTHTNTMTEQRLAQILAAIGFSTKGASTEEVEVGTDAPNQQVGDTSIKQEGQGKLKQDGIQQVQSKRGAKKRLRLPKLSVVKELLNAIGIDADLKVNMIGDASKQDAYAKAEKLLQSQDFQEAYRKAEQWFQNKSSGELDDEGKRLVENIHQSWDEADGFKKEATKSLRESEDYQQQASHIESQGSTINMNLDSGFAEWLINQPRDNAKWGRLGISGAADLIDHQPKLAMRYLERYLSQSGLAPQKPTEIPDDPQTMFKTRYDNESRHAIVEVNEQNALQKMERLKTQGMEQGLKPVSNQGLLQGFDEKELEIQSKIANQQKTIEQKHQENAKRHEEQSRKFLPGVAAKQEVLHAWDGWTHAADLGSKGAGFASKMINKFTNPNDSQNNHEDDKSE